MSAAGPACPACGGTASRAAGSKSGYTLRTCRECGTLFADLAASPPTDPTGLYTDAYGAEEPVPPLVVASLERLVATAEAFRSTGRWLDVGFGQGDLLDVAARRGWSCYGTEVARPALDRARRRGFTVADDALADARFPAGGFDVVTMIELLEHVPEPRRFLAAAAALLRPGGLLYATTPNASSLNRRALGLGWSAVVPPEHLTLWTARGLRRALAAAGFEACRVRTEGLNPYEIAARLRRGARPGAGAAPTFNRNESAQRLAAAFAGGPARRALKTAINAGLSLLGVGDTLKVRAVRAGAGP